MRKRKLKPEPPIIRCIDMIWLAIFWCAIIIIMEKVKWEAARLLVNVSLLSTLFGCIGIIVGEVLKYTAAKRLYKLIPWLRTLVNFNGNSK